MRLQSYIIALFLSTGFVAGFGQSEEVQDGYHMIHHVNGSELKGEILSWTTDSIKFRLANGVEVTFSVDAVSKVTSLDTEEVEKVLPYRFKERGIYNVTTMAPSAGPEFGLSTTHAIGYRFSRMLSIGGGLGIESFELGSGRDFVPLFAEVRGFFLPKKFSPYYAARLGYGIALQSGLDDEEKSTGGAMGSVELGCRFGASRAAQFFAGIGVHVQEAKYENTWPWEGSFTDRITYRRTELRLGVIF